MRAVDEPISLKTKVCRPVCRRPSVMIERRDPLWNRLTHNFQVFEKFRHTAQKVSKSGCFWTMSSRDSKTRIPGRLWQKKYSKVEWNCRVSKWRNLSCSSRRRTTPTRSSTSSWTVIEAKLGSSWSSWETSQWDGRIEAISRVYIRYIFKEKINRRSRHYPWTHRQDTGITEWNQLHEWFDRFSRCWISTQWTIPRCQSTSVLPTSFRSWWNAKPFSGNAEPQKWAATHSGHAWYNGKRFCKFTGVFFITFCRRTQSLDSQRNGTHITACNEWTSNTRHGLGSEMPVRTVSQKLSHSWWGRYFEELWGRPTTTADSSFWQIHHASNICLLEDKIQDWGMSLFTISYGSYAFGSSKISSGGIFVIDNKIPSHFELKSWISSCRRLIVNKSA